MKRFIEGEDRQQVALLPDCLDDYIGDDNSVRVVVLHLWLSQSVQSSHCLEHEAQRNVEVMRLTGRLAPDCVRLPP